MKLPRSGQEPARRTVDGWKVTATGPELGVSGVAVADEGPSPNRGVLPLLIVFIGLAVATVWFVVFPVLDRPKPPGRPVRHVHRLQVGLGAMHRRAGPRRAEPECPALTPGLDSPA